MLNWHPPAAAAALPVQTLCCAPLTVHSLHIACPLAAAAARLPTAWGRPDAYDSPLQFRDDVRLVFDNCRLYSVPGAQLCSAFDRCSVTDAL